jgi:hypothetical protein
MEFVPEYGVVDLTVYSGTKDKGNMTFTVTPKEAADIVFYLESIFGDVS